MMKGANGAQYALLVGDEPDPYENWVAHQAKTSEIGELCMSMLRGGGTLIDVGAAIGWVSIPVAATGSRVLAIEMNPSNCLRLHQAIRVNRLANMRLLQTAASDFDGLIRFEGDAAWGHISSSPSAKEVLCQRIDSIMHDEELREPIVGPVVMKIDVETHEHAVIAGAREFIKRYRPMVVFECIEEQGNPIDVGNSKAAKQNISEMGYSLFLLSNKVLVPKRLDEPQEGHVSDFVAVANENLATLASLPYEIRQLTDDEKLARVRLDSATPLFKHQAHVRGLIEHWSVVAPHLSTRAQTAHAEAVKQLPPAALQAH